MKCHTFTVLTAIALLISGAAATCGDICRFRMCRSTGGERVVGTNLNLGAPNTPVQGPVICLPGVDMGFVRQTGEAFLEDEGVRISRWRPQGLSNRFAPDFISTRRVRALGRSGPTRAVAEGNQWSFLDRRCIRIPIVQYEVRGPVFSIVDTPGRRSDCVSITALAPRLQIDTAWQSRDDLDLKVIDPFGRELSRSSKRAGDGRFGIDNAVGVCGSKPVAVGKEGARWGGSAFVPRGRYTISLRHFNNCGAGRTRWQLRVVLDGQLVLFRNGRSNRGGNRLILETTVNI